MSEPPDFNTLKILHDHGIPRKITLDVDKEELRKDLIDSGLDKRFVQNLIKVLGAGMTLDMDWEFLEDYDREEVQSRITRRTMLKPEVVSEVLDVIYTIYEIRSAESYDDLKFEESDDGLILSKCDEDAISIKIPSMVVLKGELYLVKQIKYAFNCCFDLETVEIPDSVECIGEWAFKDCHSLSSIVIPDSVKTIGDSAFKKCYSLSSIVIPDSVTEIYQSAFAGCTSLESVSIPNSLEIIENRMFNGCKSLVSIIIPNSVKRIDPWSFKDCKKIKTITIPSSVKCIGIDAFIGCTSLTSIEVSPNNNYFESSDGILYKKGRKVLVRYPPNKKSFEYTIEESVIEIGMGAFSDCNHLMCLTLSSSVSDIDGQAFRNCEYLRSIDAPPNNNHYESSDGILYTKGKRKLVRCPQNKQLNEIIIIESAIFDTTISTSLPIPHSVSEIGAYAFDSCDQLTSIIIPNSVKTIGRGAFKHTKLSLINIPESVTTINDEVFQDCKWLVSVNIPESVTNIGAQAFDSCENLTSISIPNSVKTIGRGAFRKSHLKSIKIPKSVTDIGSHAFDSCDYLKAVSIPNSVKTIGDFAFFKCSSLESVWMPFSLKTLGSYVFKECYRLNKESLERIENVQICSEK